MHPLSAYSWVIPLYYKGEPIIIPDVYKADFIPTADLPAMEAAQVISYILIPLIKNNVLVGTLTASEPVPRQWNEYEVALLAETAERIWAAVERARAEAALRESELERVREQAALEQERQRAEALAALDRAKTLFSNVSHEFRTPLTLSLVPLQDALNDRTHPLDLVHRKRLELVHHNSLRLLKLVNTLLDFSRIEAGRMEAICEPTDLAICLSDSIKSEAFRHVPMKDQELVWLWCMNWCGCMVARLRSIAQLERALALQSSFCLGQTIYRATA